MNRRRTVTKTNNPRKELRHAHRGLSAVFFFGIAIFLSSLFLILLVLVQRGRGGGLTGALGGPGGQSAFGTKAGDLFTRITIGIAAVWIFLCASAVYFLKTRGLPTLNAAPRIEASMEGTGDTTIDGTSGNVPGGASSGTTGLSIPPIDFNSIAPGNVDGTVPASGDVQAEIAEFPSPEEAEAGSETGEPTPTEEATPPTDESAPTSNE